MGYAIKLKRVHDEPEADDGARVLVDPVLPKDKNEGSLGLDEWYSKAAPSISLRNALRKNDISFEQFVGRYHDELHQKLHVLTPLLKHARQRGLTLLSYKQLLNESFLPTLQEVLLRILREEDVQATGVELSSPTCYDS